MSAGRRQHPIAVHATQPGTFQEGDFVARDRSEIVGRGAAFCEKTGRETVLVHQVGRCTGGWFASDIIAVLPRPRSPSQTKLVPHLVESDSIKEILASARPIAHKSITTFANLRQDVLSDLQNIDKVG